MVFPRFNGAGGAVQWNGTAWSEAADAADSLLVDETFHVMVNGSYVPGASITHAREGDECRPHVAPDGSYYVPVGGVIGSGSLPTYCSSMTYLSAGFLHVQSAVSAALGTRALGSANCPAAGLQVNIGRACQILLAAS